MKGKSSDPIFFEVELNWLSQTKGILTANDTCGPIYVDTPLRFGGVEKDWTPEHLFLSSLSSCYMSTLFSFMKKMDLAAVHFECKVIGEIEPVEGKYKFTTINLFPKLCVADEAAKTKALAAIEKTNTYCIISNSIDAVIYYHTVIDIQELRESVLNGFSV
jgi:organic hydroperoxide reductase OsmC/OhrA